MQQMRKNNEKLQKPRTTLEKPAQPRIPKTTKRQHTKQPKTPTHQPNTILEKTERLSPCNQHQLRQHPTPKRGNKHMTHQQNKTTPLHLDEFVTAKTLKNLEQKAAEAQIHG